ncbi:ST14 transmembrane serine protease matriptase a [Chanos chanos]|uniref:Suppressor of tumorigenicity 14 protein homolog n=1 Tax=Chanos chanos TaxID=29144 RepID=A0A6J2UQ71_CHACN|nr:suppressor of tumorigenicity 14 protein homolog [Chanos chanos]
MDPMNSGMRYTPKSPDRDWDQSVTFLPASDSKKLEKKKGPGKMGAVIGLVVFLAIVALMTGLLVWHFHFRRDVRVKKMYGGSMRITNQVFVDAYERPNSTEFKSLALQVVKQLKDIYKKTPQLAKYYVKSTVHAFSEGSVIAYYMSEFSVPVEQEAAVEATINSMDQIVAKDQRRNVNQPGNSLLFDNIVSASVDKRMFSSSFSSTHWFAQHTRSNHIGTIESPGFPDYPYPSNTLIQWQLRADAGYRIKLDFDTFNLEENCQNDYVRVYDSLVAVDSKLMAEKCGYYSPSDPLTFISSGNVMLVTLVTNDKHNYPGFRASVSQISQDSRDLSCGGKLRGTKGTFTSPNYPNYYPPLVSCLWDIEVPADKHVRVQFSKFLLPKTNQGCTDDYVDIDSKKRLCGQEISGLIESSESNRITVAFVSSATHVDRGFSATFEAFEPTNPCPGKFQCPGKRCIDSKLQCDGWNDCGDNSDERNCKCPSDMISCKNGLCKPMFWKCDGVDDCGDGTDEQNCGCKHGEFQCRNDRCVSEKKKCDRRDDCGDGSDEEGCGGRTDQIKCTEETYMCADRSCLTKVNPECDGINDCSDGSDEANCDCGKQPFKTSRIVGGQNAMEGEFPWQVSLHIKNSAHVCGASIISNKWLVTAAHCVQDAGQHKLSQANAWDVYLGLHSQKVKTKAEKRGLKRIVPHPQYNDFTFDFDIALMELDRPVDFSDTISPVCMPAATHVFPAGKSVTITGWGATREGGYGADVLQKADVRIINTTVCNTLMGGQITSRMLCAGVLSGGVDACQGDSGGPLSSKADVGNRMFLAGVVSWGDGCARRNKPGIYTKVTKLRSWIKDITGV